MIGACIHGAVREDIAVIEGGDAFIYKIDRVWLPQPSGGRFEVRPGGHTVDVTATAVRPMGIVTRIYRSGLTTLCVKARPGHGYRIKSRVRDGRMELFFVDDATGEPPKTPCGPDEDDD